MEIREFREGDVLGLAPDGSVAGSEEISAIEAKLATSLKAGFRLLVLDCAEVGQLSSAAIRILLMTSRKLDRTEGRLVLCGVNAKVQKAFSISGFDKDFTIVATRQEALHRVLEPVHPRPARSAKAAPPKRPVVADVVPPPAVVAEAAPAPVPPPAAEQAVAAPPAPVAPPPGPDPLEELATALLETLGPHISRHESAGRVPPSDLDALASGLLAALRVA